jgi:glutathione S-transferase
MTPAVQEDVNRISGLWRECRKRYGADGPFLFGAFGAADVMFAPVVTRFSTYAVALDKAVRAHPEAAYEHGMADLVAQARAAG